MGKKFAVILSGCGFQDGAEIQESVCTLLAIERAGGTYSCFAPDIDQHHVTNHLSSQASEGETRNVLVESARIARGAIKPLSEFKASDFDALVLPGGFGGALNLSTFAINGPDCTVNADVEKAIKSVAAAGKPIGSLCITPAIMAKVLGEVELTIGNDKGTAEALEKLGAKHKETTFGEIVVDKTHKLVTAPCYMLDSKVSTIADEAQKVVNAVLEMA
ncbi:MAG TPA: isoprenoid biosynthesis glyoxalase ElbB [Nitrospiria bacterium]